MLAVLKAPVGHLSGDRRLTYRKDCVVNIHLRQWAETEETRSRKNMNAM